MSEPQWSDHALKRSLTSDLNLYNPMRKQTTGKERNEKETEKYKS